MASVIGRFRDPGELIEAVHAARRAGYRQLEAHAPFPVPGLDEALGFRERWIPVISLVMGVLAAVATFALQWYSAVVDYPFIVGGKPLNSWPAFILPTTALCILSAVLAAFITMLAGNRLPKPYHPAFDWPAFDRASEDGFFLLIEHEAPDAPLAFLRERAAEARELPG